MKKSSGNELHDQLRIRTRELHVKAHSVPYIKALLNNDIQLISYVGHLRALAIIHGTLENQLKQIHNQLFTELTQGYKSRLHFILSDLEFLNAAEVKDVIPAVNEAFHVADKILVYSALNPLKLIGFIYILVGAQNGGNILKKHITETLHLKENQGTSYFFSDDESGLFWESFISKINSSITDKAQREDIIDAAVELFNCLLRIYESITILDQKNLGNHITSLNPEAGNYPITTNPVEISVSIRSGMICWDMFSYYAHRYGERGRRFARSDAVWLVSVSELPEQLATEQVKWLARYLAIRGMPTYTMEVQMRLHYKLLSEKLSEYEVRYRKFLKAADELKATRNKFIDDSFFEKSNELFEKNLDLMSVSDSSEVLPVKNTGLLIASSLADARNNIPDAVASLKNWLTDVTRFPAGWIAAVKKTFKDLEDIMGKRPDD